MSAGWSLWVMFLVVLNMGITFGLFLWAPHAKVPKLDDGTTGHVWAHGAIREGLNRLPTWWIVFSGSMFAGAFGYLILYPGFGANKGLLGWTQHGQHAEQVAENHAKLGSLMDRLSLYSVEQLAADPAALQLGERLFGDNCAACHGRPPSGNNLIGAPNLSDDTWLYGGDGDAITKSISGGRHGVMPPWSALGSETVDNLVEHVRSLSGLPSDAAMAARGASSYQTTCIACHGADGSGNPALGAPNLTDDNWLYGKSRDAIHKTIHDGRNGHMPAWSGRLTEQQIHVLAAWVYQLSEHGDGKADN